MAGAPDSWAQWRIIPVTLIGFPIAIVLVSLFALGLGGPTRSTVGGICSLIVLFMVLSSVLSITSMAVGKVEWLGTLAYLTPDSAMNSFLGAGISSSAQSTLAEAVKPYYWIPEWWQSGLILIAWAAAAWIGGLIITGKADIRYQITRVTALAVLPVRPWSWQFVMAMALAVLQ